jgi:6-pyruvoyltetrahydropterin/6-carboxytetrahydropterin synthase
MSTRTTIKKRFSWHMAHRLINGYRGICANLHGHTYSCEIEISGEANVIGMLVDFALLKEYLAEFVVGTMDHAVLATSNDSKLIAFCLDNKQRLHIMPDHYTNTTAENVAHCLFGIAFEVLRSREPHLTLESITVWETETSSAKVRRSK